MSYTSSRTQVKTTTSTYTTQSGQGKPTTRSTKETTTTTSTRGQPATTTKYSEQILRVGRPGTKGAQEIITKSYQQPAKVTETKTRYDPKTGTTQKTTTTGYQPATKVTTETWKKYGPNASTTQTTTTTKYQPNTQVVTETKRYGTPTTTTRKYGPVTTSSKQTTTTTTTTTKYPPTTTVTETRRKYGPVTTSTKETTTTTTKYQPTTKVTETRTRYGQTTGGNDYVTVPLKVTETKTRYGPDSKSSKEVTYTTYQQSRAKPITDSYRDKDNKVYVVSEKRSEKYTNDNGNVKKNVTVEKTVSDGSGKREYRRFYGSK